MKKSLQRYSEKISKIFFAICLLTTLSFAPHTATAKVHKQMTISMTKCTIVDVFTKVTALSGLSFFYDDNLIRNTPKVTLNLYDANIHVILEALEKQTNLGFVLNEKDNLVTVAPKAASKVQRASNSTKAVQEQRRVSGQVTDENGDPLIGVGIIEQKTGKNSTTDIDGKYSIEVPEEGILQFTYIGFITQAITVKGLKEINVVLKENTIMMDEVVVVGFGTQKKVNLTGAVAMAGAKDLQERPVTRAVQALQGSVPGLQITSTGGSLENRESISIRGVGSIGEGSSSSPLILIDGMEGDIHSINPQDIESISVLKDAAASSIYGSRAPFGVILITTKKGTKGKTIINYNNSFRFNKPNKTPKTLDSYSFATYFNDAGINAGETAFFNDNHLQRILDYQQGKLKESIDIDTRNPQYWGDGYRYGNANTNWYDALYKKHSFSQEHNMSVSGANDKASYYTSFNYLGQEGFMKLNDDNYDRFTVTGKMDINVTDWLKVMYSSRFTREDYKRPSTMNSIYFDLARQGWPTLPLYDPNGYYYSSPSPALSIAEGGQDKTQTDNIYQQGAVVIEPIKDWITNVNVNYRVYNQNNHWDLQTLYNHDVDGNPYIVGNGASEVHEALAKDNYMNISATTEYTLDLKSGHNIKTMLGFQSEEKRQTRFGVTKEGIMIPWLTEIDVTTGNSYSGEAVPPSVNGARNSWSNAGFFGRVNYNFMERYLLEANLRYDGTSKFRNNLRWNWFPSFSVGWNIMNEDFMSPLTESFLDNLKIRLSYGRLGNEGTSSWYPTYSVIPIGTSNGSWLQNGKKPNTANIPGLVSSSLKWETIESYNLGLDFGFLHNRLVGSMDLFRRNTLDMMGPGPELPAALGQSVPNINNTDLKTYGFELSISWRDHLSNGLTYGAKFSLMDAQTKITKYNNVTGTLNTHYTGKMWGEIWGYETIGIARSQEEMDNHLATLPKGGQNALGNNWAAGDIMYKDIDGDGRINAGSNTLSDPGDKRIIGNNTPRYQLGFELTGEWKGIDCRIYLQGVAKRDFWADSYYFWGVNGNMWYSGGLQEHLDYYRAEASNHLAENINSYYPRPLFNTTKNQQVQTGYLQNAAYLRLKNFQVGYTIPKVFTNKFHVNNLRVYFSGENLFTITNMAKMFDPETVGHNYGNGYPLSRTLSFGLSATF